jgi:hypothetical protein
VSEETKNKVMGKINQIKSNIETFISDVNVSELKASLNVIMKDAQKDISQLVEKDLETVRTRLQKEKEDFETKAKKFLDGHKRELATLQDKFDKLVKASSKIKRGKVKTKSTPTSESPNSKKKVIKKPAKVTKKQPGFKPKATKKFAKKKA